MVHGAYDVKLNKYSLMSLGSNLSLVKISVRIMAIETEDADASFSLSTETLG